MTEIQFLDKKIKDFHANESRQTLAVIMETLRAFNTPLPFSLHFFFCAFWVPLLLLLLLVVSNSNRFK